MELEFTKMHGLGNDFVVLDGFRQDIVPDRDQIRAMADRRLGVGCDQVLLIQPGARDGVDVRYRIFNQDGDEVEQCGNGARCIAAYMVARGYASGDVITAATMTGEIHIHHNGGDRYRVDMGVPEFEPAAIPLAMERRSREYSARLSGGEIRFMAVSMGNPHAVLVVNDCEHAPVEQVARELQGSALFPRGVNVGFLQVLDPARARLRVYERGVGETLACGTGACAAMATGRAADLLDEQVEITLPGGQLTVSWEGEGHPVWMTGPATTVYTGTISL